MLLQGDTTPGGSCLKHVKHNSNDIRKMHGLHIRMVLPAVVLAGAEQPALLAAHLTLGKLCTKDITA
jgi:hypothetical protein